MRHARMLYAKYECTYSGFITSCNSDKSVKRDS